MAFNPMMLGRMLAPQSTDPRLNQEERDLQMYQDFLASRGEAADPIQALVQGTAKTPEEAALEEKMSSIQGLMERRQNLGQKYQGMKQAAMERGIQFNPMETAQPSAPGNIQPLSRRPDIQMAEQQQRAMEMQNQAMMKAGQQPAGSSGGGGGGGGGGFGPSSYGYTGKTGVAGTKGSAPYGFQPEMWRALTAANAAMKAAGLGNFGITDGWRSYEAQVDVKRRKPNLAATPGRSVHGLGLAADLKLNSQQLKWLKANGARFGIKNLPSESWHWQLGNYQWKG